MIPKIRLRYVATFLCALALVALLLPTVFATGEEVSVTGINGVEVSVDSNGTATESNGTVTVTATGTYTSGKTATVTVTNNTGSTATISFDYSATQVSSCSLGTVSSNKCSGTYSKLLTAGSSFTFTFKTRTYSYNNYTATVKLSNFKVEAAAASSNVTINYDDTAGSVTVAGVAVKAGSVHEISSATGAALVATPNSGASFYGWYDVTNNKLLSDSAAYTLIPTNDMTVKAVFAFEGGTACFAVGTSSTSWGTTTVSLGQVFDDLNAAISHAQTNGYDTIVPVNSGTLPAGDYTIPAGITLLIPYDSANTLVTDTPTTVGDDPVFSGSDEAHTAPYAYRTLTLASGATITVDGSMSLAAKMYAADGGEVAGVPNGPVGFVAMKDGSNITVNGTLYAWGYITGSGTVTANKTATVYECFQIAGWRGGDMTTSASNEVFPLSQYYVQNIEVPITYCAGAKEIVATAVSLSLGYTPVNHVDFIGSADSMFSLTEGTLTKDYEESTDRLIVDLNDVTLTVSPILLEALNTSLGSASIDSADFILPLTSNLTINLNSGTAIVNQDLSLIPGAQLNIVEDAIFRLGTVDDVAVNLYVYDSDDWGAFSWNGSNRKFIPLNSVPGRKNPRTEADLLDAAIMVNGTLDANGGCIYTTTGGANIYSTSSSGEVINIVGQETTTKQMEQYYDSSNNPYLEYIDIGITPAKLLNKNDVSDDADDDYTETANAAGTYYYNVDHGRWVKDGHSATSSVVTAPTCTEKGENKISCSCGYSTTEEVAALGHTEVIDAAVAATCTATGLTAGSHCSVCSEVLVAQTEVAALGHTEVTDEAVAATCTKTGLMEGSHCDTCGETITAQEVVNAKGHTDENSDDQCDVCGSYYVLKIVAANVAVGDSLDLYFYVYADAVEALGGKAAFCAVLKKSFADGWETDREGTQTIEGGGENEGWEEYTDDGIKMYRFCYSDIPAKEMTDEVTATIYYSSDTQHENPACESRSESVESYALRELRRIDTSESVEDSDKKLRTALVDMLNYGAACQEYFDYGTDTLANAKLTNTQKGYATPSNPQCTTSELSNLNALAGVTISMKNKLMFTFYFDEIEIDSSTVTVTITDTTGNELENVNVSASLYSPENSTLVGVDVSGISYANTRLLIVCALKDSNGNTITATDSIEGYVARYNGESPKVFMNLMKFSDSACAYFDSLS